jgi:CheY-like chemotaxis protein/anti-sigma regulatory factor (Ser/Thr protein kinase)
VQGHLSHLLQGVSKVAENAIKFTETGEVVVRASVVSTTADAIVVDIAVADTGPGIPQARQLEIFRPFAHASEPRTTQTGGTGLGLAITSRLMAAMDGAMRLESVAGSGSTFHMTVPLRRDPEDTFESTADSVLQGHAVLVVDDNLAACDALLATLRAWGATATAVRNAEEAGRTLRAAHDEGHPFALAVVDANLHGVDGFALTARWQADPDMARTPVVLVTASGRAADLQRARKVGASACVMTPFVPTRELRGVLEEALLSAQDPERRTSARQPAARAPLNVLLVEDNDVGRMVTTRLIEKAGHHVVSAVNGVEAVTAAEEQRFDVILMDVQMPEMDGFQATAAIRERERVTGDHVPIVALTAYAMSGERERALHAGMDAYVSKPVRSGELFATIERLQRETVREEAPLVCAWEAPQVLDAAALREQAGSDPNSLFDTAWRLLSESRGLLENIRGGIDSGDRNTVEQGARQLKGSLRTLTAASARTAALRLEAVARAGDLSQVSDLMSHLEHEVDRLEPVISLLDVNRADA